MEKTMHDIDVRVEGLNRCSLQSFDDGSADRTTTYGDFENVIQCAILEALKDTLLYGADAADPPRLEWPPERCRGVLHLVEMEQRSTGVENEFVIDHRNVGARAVEHASEQVNLQSKDRCTRGALVLHVGRMDEHTHFL